MDRRSFVSMTAGIVISSGSTLLRGVQQPSNTKGLRFGRRPSRPNGDALRLSEFLKSPMAVPPPAYDFDDAHPGLPIPTFLNDQLNDCVIAARAHQTLRFKDVTEHHVINITDVEVRNEYFAESGGNDDGLVMTDSVDKWQTRGWVAGAKVRKIKTYLLMRWQVHDELKAAILSDIGVELGNILSTENMSEFYAGQPWTPTGYGHFRHAVYVFGYNPQGPVCITWGRKQQMTWAFLDVLTEEAFAIVDDVVTLSSHNSRIDSSRLLKALQQRQQ